MRFLITSLCLLALVLCLSHAVQAQCGPGGCYAPSYGYSYNGYANSYGPVLSSQPYYAAPVYQSYGTYNYAAAPAVYSAPVYSQPAYQAAPVVAPRRVVNRYYAAPPVYSAPMYAAPVYAPQPYGGGQFGFGFTWR